MLTPEEIQCIDQLPPVHITLFIAEGCPICPSVIDSLTELAGQTKTIHLDIVDASRSPDKAASENIRSVPTTLLENRFRWVGRFDIRELVQMITDPHIGSPGKESIRNMIESGDAEGVADLICRTHSVFEGLIDLIVDEKWSLRLGGMVAAEYLSCKNPDLCKTLIGKVWNRFLTVSDTVKGDILHLMSLLDADAVKSHFEAIMESSKNPEIRKIAEEVLRSGQEP